MNEQGLAAEVWGRGERLVLAHGFTQNSRCWGPFGHELAADHEVVAVDLPGHGRTDPAHDTADLPTVGRLLAEVGGDAVYIGYSMGGRAALHAALAHPERVRALVLIGATAGMDDPAARAARRRADETLAADLLAGGLPAFLQRWLANPLFAGLPPSAAAVNQRLANRPEGLAASLRHTGTGTQEPRWGDLERLTMPVLVLAGADDTKFTAEGSRLVEHLPRARMRTLPGTHAVHLAQPTAAAAAVRWFLAAELGGEY
ncbi:MAG: alpha/beta fold hydrolase [Acidimicrobiia bacterium]|nr:alpha/beta fold hydrolase [Acidimicrobiia bacterium]